MNFLAKATIGAIIGVALGLGATLLTGGGKNEK